MAFCPQCGVGGVPGGSLCSNCGSITTAVVTEAMLQTREPNKIVVTIDDEPPAFDATATVPYVAPGQHGTQSAAPTPRPVSARVNATPFVPLQQPKTSGMAIAALVCGILGFSVVAITLGFIARSQISSSGGREKGEGMATTGIVLGFLWIGISVLIFIAIFAAASSMSSSYPNG
jgi:hypothetical protein